VEPGSIPLREYLEALRTADKELAAERDRRYTELAIAEEKALKIKEAADHAALDLARQIQTYKDEKANELREQISSERHLYVTVSELASMKKELEAQLQPISDYVAAQQGRSGGETDTKAERRYASAQVIAVVSVVLLALSIAISVILATHTR
jgi:vacuolar-type H+-ATPase subunit H